MFRFFLYTSEFFLLLFDDEMYSRTFESSFNVLKNPFNGKFKEWRTIYIYIYIFDSFARVLNFRVLEPGRASFSLLENIHSRYRIRSGSLGLPRYDG